MSLIAVPIRVHNYTVGLPPFLSGQQKHPISGFGLLQNVECFENPGLCKIKNRALLNFSPTKQPIAEVYDNYGNTYTLDGYGTNNGTLYKNGLAIQANIQLPWDLKIHKDYVVVSYSSDVSFYGPVNNSPSWLGVAYSGFDSNHFGNLAISIDPVQGSCIYRTNGNNVATIFLTPAAPSVSPTIAVNPTALKLLDGLYAVTLDDLGINLIVGTYSGQNYTQKNNQAVAQLFSWNKQLGTLGNNGLAGLPVVFDENGINATQSYRNILYVSAGTHGNIYKTDGTNYSLIATLPYAQSGIDISSTVFKNAMSISQQGNLVVGLSIGAIGTGITARAGIYEVALNIKDNPIQFRTLSTGLVSSTTGEIDIGFVNTLNYRDTSVGWGNSGVFGVDTNDEFPYTSGVIIEGSLDRVGLPDALKTYQRVKWEIAEPLVFGQSIKISYRLNTKDTYTEIGYWGFDGTGGAKQVNNVVSFTDTAGISDAELLQLKVELFQIRDPGVLYGTNMNLVSVSIF